VAARGATIHSMTAGSTVGTIIVCPSSACTVQSMRAPRSRMACAEAEMRAASMSGSSAPSSTRMGGKPRIASSSIEAPPVPGTPPKPPQPARRAARAIAPGRARAIEPVADAPML